MKKSIFFVAATAALALSACGPKAPQAHLDNEMDSLSYAMGLSQTKGLKSYLATQAKLDTTKMGDFVKGFLEGTAAKELSPKQKAIEAGVNLGNQIRGSKEAIDKQVFASDSTKSLNLKEFVKGFLAASVEKDTTLNAMTASAKVSEGVKALKDSVNTVNADSLSFLMGVAQSRGFEQYLTSQLHVDEDQIGTFATAFKKSVFSNPSVAEKAVSMGKQIGNQLATQMFANLNKELGGNDSVTVFNQDNFIAGFVAGATSTNELMDVDSAATYVQTAMKSIQENKLLEQYGDNKKAGEDFLEANKAKDGVVTTPSGLQYKVLKKGRGKIAGPADKVKVHYEGTLLDGTVFDSSYERKEPATFSPNQVIKGWQEALTMMPEGSTYELYIPQELAYGERNAGKIKPFSALIFKVELLKVEKAKK